MSIQTALDRIVATLDSAAESADLVLTRDYMTSEVSVLRLFPAQRFDAVLVIGVEAHFGSLALAVTIPAGATGEERVLHTRCTLDAADDTVEQLCKIIRARRLTPTPAADGVCE